MHTLRDCCPYTFTNSSEKVPLSRWNGQAILTYGECRMTKTKDPFPHNQFPDGLDNDEKLAFAIGLLMMEWANLESVLRAIYVCVVGSPDRTHSEIAWLSTMATRTRCDLLKRSNNASDLPQEYKDEIQLIVNEFESLNKTRNFFAHAGYSVDPNTLTVTMIESYSLNLEETIFTTRSKQLNVVTLNEILSTANRCRDTNRKALPVLIHLWRLRYPDANPPEIPPGYGTNANFPT